MNSIDKRGRTARAILRLHTVQDEQGTDRCPAVVHRCPAIGQKMEPTNVAIWEDRAVDGKIFNSSGTDVGVLQDNAVLDLSGRKLYELKGAKIYKLSGELVGHLQGRGGADVRLSKSMDALF